MLKSIGVGPEGQLSKLDHMVLALKFCRSNFERNEYYSQNCSAVREVLETLSDWKKRLRVDKRKLGANRLDNISRLKCGLDEVGAP